MKSSLIKNKNPFICAIVPAYNEGSRIRRVLEILSKTPILDEVIVVDDGSYDHTADIVREFKNIRYIRNEINQGKGEAMERGVQATNASIIFFCDADLRDITPEIVRAIIEPVVHGSVDMYIGIRNNISQKLYMPFGRNSGERALRRETWEALPHRYKKGFRIEVGLNYLIRRSGGKVDYKIFPYYQEIKENKYGFIRGTYERWRMNWDVVLAFFLLHTLDRSLRLNNMKNSIKTE